MTRRVSLTGISTDTPGRNAGTQYNPRAANLIRLPSGSLVELSEPVIDPGELGASFLFLLLLLGEALIIGCAYFGYQAFVS